MPPGGALRYGRPTMLKLQGAFTALVSPFKADLSIDFEALDRLIDFQLSGGISGLVPVGTTGESPTLDNDEQQAVIAHVVKRVAGRVPVIAGAGSNSTREAIHRSKRAVEAGASAVMHVMPYYSKPTQGGLIAHLREIAKAIPSTPIVLYNIPGRSGCDLLPESVESVCAACSNVIAIKEATSNIVRAQELLRRLGDRLTVLCGDDALTLGMMACGAKGVISVTSNLLPAPVQSVCTAMLQGRTDEARQAHLALLPVHEAMFLESNPAPVKSALADAGIIAAHLRLPLVLPSEATTSAMKKVLNEYRSRRSQ
ncbi:MAG: 4-hydroxy-tetrahydrodipicolinate synthase [Polyangiales bacterium]